MKKINVYFYRNLNNTEPVREFLQKLNKEDKKIIGIDLKTVEFGWPIGMPVCRPLSGGLYEVRSNLTSGKIARIIFCIEKSNMILLHGFIKKAQKIPHKELELAKQRYRSI